MTDMLSAATRSRATRSRLLSTGRVVAFGFATLATGGAAMAQERFVLENLSATYGSTSIRIPQMSVTGSAAQRAAILAALDGASTRPLSERLAALSFASATIPEWIQEDRATGAASRVVYRDMSLTNVVRGRVGSLVIANGSGETSRPGKPAAKLTMGRIAIQDMDMAEQARVFGEAGAPDAPLRQLIASMEIAGFQIDQGADGWVGFGRSWIRDVRGRAFETPLWSLATLAAAAQGPAARNDPARTRETFRYFVGAYESLSISEAEVTDIAIRNATPEGTVETRVARVGGDGQGGVVAEGLVTRLPNNGEVTTARAGWSNFSLAPTIAGLRRLLARPEPIDVANLDAREIMPGLGRVYVENVSGRIPAGGPSTRPGPGRPAVVPEPIPFTLGGYELTLGNQLRGVPTRFDLRVNRAAFALPANASDPTSRGLRDAGVSRLDLSLRVAGTWEEASQQVQIDEISLSDAQLGSLRLQGTVGNIPRDTFTGSWQDAQIALLGAAARRVTLDVRNTGWVQAALRVAAAQSGQAPDGFQRSLAQAAPLVVPGVLGNAEGGRQLGTALGRFLNDPRSLNVEAVSRDPAGIGASDVFAAREPSEVMRKIEIRTRVNE